MKYRSLLALAVLALGLLFFPALSHAAVVTSSVTSNAPDSLTITGSSYLTANYVDVKIGTTSVRYYRPDGPYGYKNPAGQTVINWSDAQITITHDVSLAGQVVQSVTFYVSGPYNYTLHPALYISPLVTNVAMTSPTTFNVSGSGFQNASYIALATANGVRVYYNPLAAGSNPAGVTVNTWNSSNIQITDVRASLAGLVFSNLEFYGGTPTSVGASEPVDLFFPFHLTGASSAGDNTLRVTADNLSNATSFRVTFADNTTANITSPGGVTSVDLTSSDLTKTVVRVDAYRNADIVDSLTGLNIVFTPPVALPTFPNPSVANSQIIFNGGTNMYGTTISYVLIHTDQGNVRFDKPPTQGFQSIAGDAVSGFVYWTDNLMNLKRNELGCTTADSVTAYNASNQTVGSTFHFSPVSIDCTPTLATAAVSTVPGQVTITGTHLLGLQSVRLDPATSAFNRTYNRTQPNGSGVTISSWTNTQIVLIDRDIAGNRLLRMQGTTNAGTVLGFVYIPGNLRAQSGWIVTVGPAHGEVHITNSFGETFDTIESVTLCDATCDHQYTFYNPTSPYTYANVGQTITWNAGATSVSTINPNVGGQTISNNGYVIVDSGSYSEYLNVDPAGITVP